MVAPGGETVAGVGILRETAADERRVILSPPAIKYFVEAGLAVVVERGAGQGVGYSDEQYRRAGAQVVSCREVWNASLVLKLRAPTPSECASLRPGMTLCGLFHPEGSPALVRALVEAGVRGISVEYMTTPEGLRPLALPGAEIAGRMAVLYAAMQLQFQGGRGILMGGVRGARPAKVVVLGYGNVGGAAARVAAALGADVVVLGTRRHGLSAFAATVPQGIRCRLISPEVLAEELPTSDVLIGAVLISTFDTEPIVGEELVRRMPAGSVIIDATAGYGQGYLPTAPETTFGSPFREVHGVHHCRIDRLPSAVPVTWVEAFSSVAAPYLAELAQAAQPGSALPPTLQAGVFVEAGRVVHPEVARHLRHFDSIAMTGGTVASWPS